MGILKDLELDYSLDDIEMFLQNLSKACDAFEPLIFSLNSSTKCTEAIIKIEQYIHNISYWAKRLELSEFVKFCEFCEAILAEALKANRALSSPFTEWMLLLAAQFETYLQDYESDASFISVMNPKLVSVPNF